MAEGSCTKDRRNVCRDFYKLLKEGGTACPPKEESESFKRIQICFGCFGNCYLVRTQRIVCRKDYRKPIC